MPGTPPDPSPAAELTALAALADHTRRALYDFVSAQPDAVSRDDAAAGTGFPRHVAKFNLDRLVDAGVLDVEYRRPVGRSGPGAGRTAKLYRPSAREFSASLPTRRYLLAATLLARGIRESLSRGVHITEALQQVAKGAGRALGEQAVARAGARPTLASLTDGVLEVLDEQGYGARREGPDVVLGNCPFKGLLEDGTELICTMNMNLVQGLIEACGRPRVGAHFDVQPERCCVRITGLSARAPTGK